MDGWVHIAEVPLVGRNLTVGMHVTFAQHQRQLRLSEVRIDKRQGEHMKGKIPGRVPRILPLVRHRDDVAVIHVVPMIVAWGAVLRLERIGTALGEPLVDIIVVELLGPQHARKRLPHHIGLVRIQR